MKKILFISVVTFCLFFASLSVDAQKYSSLKKAYRNDFLIGAAINATQIEEKDPNSAKLIVQQFNAITPENIMKAEVIHPGWDSYDFKLADAIVEYGKKNNLVVNGHTLIWHSQMPVFARNINSVDSFKTYFVNHINTIATRYKGKVASWDVVNEALNEDGTMRKTIYIDKIGDNYVNEAFKLAQEASPNTDLYYNDYNNEQPQKRAGCIELIKKIQQAGIRIDGVGIQGHWHVNKVPFKEIEESILAYAALGIKVMITELDIEVLPRDFTGADVDKKLASSPALNPYVNGIPDSVLQQQANDYENLFKLFLKYNNHISRVTLWGVHDGQSWLNGWPIKGRTNYPLLFDRNYQPKIAYQKIMALK